MTRAPEREFELREAVEVLERTPATIAALLSGLSPAWIHANEGVKTWSPYQVVGHLIHGERTDWIARTRHIFEHGEARAFEPFEREAMLRAGTQAPLDELLATFARERASNLETLESFQLSAADLDRRGKHPALGVVTLRELLATWVAHDLGHVAQIARVLAKRYSSDVGPWRAYLPILSERLAGPAS